jgi:diguanylate cyclase (GGDEF)-like protein/PAS domain S-box-containing protein
MGANLSFRVRVPMKIPTAFHSIMSELQGPEVFRTILDSLQTGVYMVDRERRILFWNEGAEKITGYHRHEVLGRFCRENILLHCNDERCRLCGAACPFTQTMHDGKAREARIQLRHKQGHRIPVRGWIVSIRDTHGSILGVAESFDEQRFTFGRNRHQHNLAVYGCLDETTGTPNQGFTQFHLRETLASFAAYHLPFGVMRIEVDQLGHFRAAYGREAESAILRVVAETIRKSLRPNDFLGCWAADQFLVILTDCTLADLKTSYERIRKVVSCAGLLWWGDELSVTVSAGLTTAQLEDTLDSLMTRAQQALDQTSVKLVAAAAASSGEKSIPL